MSHGLSKKFYGGSDRKALQSLLRDRGFYSTEGRLQMLSLLKRAEKPLSVTEIHRKLEDWLDEANVFRSLEALTEVGVLARSDMREAGTRYEFRQEHHHHIVCRDCGRTEDVEECGDKRLESRVLKRSEAFARIDTHALEFFGTCLPCAGRRV